ncbi:TPA: hypothetical protein N0F65_006565 [Lagenidium giganteum]|uniref:Uncharacterized protein n=1 Tax=Lagenidium giganteum TaxID=4803 RepID=A0AAV2YL35_9STRA|nr:TPA: hypothetical protein N0F65_006565 [Lagenidium giganteum]
MRVVVIPPVEIPQCYGNERAISTMVGGVTVPMTITMWRNQQRRLRRRRLTVIDEDVVFDYPYV